MASISPSLRPSMLPKVHSRHPTWPPTAQLLPTDDTFVTPRQTNLDITEDEDPFSHFLSPVLEEEFSFDDTDYTAGIIPFEPSLYARRDALFRARLEEKWETYVARRLLQNRPLSLAPQQTVAATAPSEDALPDLFDDSMDIDRAATPDSSPASPSHPGEEWVFPSTLEANMDSDDDDTWEAGRRRIQLTPPRRKFRPARRSFGRKPTWREPGPGLWTVDEAEEEDVVEAQVRGRKRSKTVRWCEEVTVVEYER